MTAKKKKRLFARRSRERGEWDSINLQTPEDASFPTDVLLDVLGGENEVSLWEIDDPNGPEVDRLVAALHPVGVNNLSDVTIRVISEWRLEKLGFPLRQSKGISLDKGLNDKHWEIDVPTIGDAIKLAKAFKDRPARSFKKSEVMRRFAESLQARRISTENVGPGLLSKLFDEGYLRVVVDQASRSGEEPSEPAAAAREAVPFPGSAAETDEQNSESKTTT